MSIKLKKKKPGYTLMELMIVVAIMGIVLLSAPRIFKNAFRFVRLSFARAEIQKNARGSLGNINRELRQAVASSIVIDQETGESKAVFMGNQRNPDASKLAPVSNNERYEMDENRSPFSI